MLKEALSLLFVSLNLGLRGSLACAPQPIASDSATPPDVGGKVSPKAGFEAIFGAHLRPGEPRAIPNSGRYQRWGGGPVRFPIDLNCDFSRPERCCWTNAQQPEDELDFTTAVGIPNLERFKEGFGDVVPPSPGNRYLVAALRHNVWESTKAIYKSCYISCATEGPTVTFKHWETGSTQLGVCEVAKGSSLLINCKQINGGEMPGPVTVKMDYPLRNSPIVIVASNFVNYEGDMVILDDISVDYSACAPMKKGKEVKKQQPKVQTGLTVASGPELVSVCSVVECDMNVNTCGWRSGEEADEALVKGLDTRFKLQKGQYKNRITGILRAPNGRKDGGYLAAYFNNKIKTAGLESEEFYTNEDTSLEFMVYRAMEGLKVEYCLNKMSNCHTMMDGSQIKANSRRWTKQYLELPKGTKKIWLLASNMGNNQGAIGFAQFKLFKALPSPVRLCV